MNLISIASEILFIWAQQVLQAMNRTGLHKSQRCRSGQINPINFCSLSCNHSPILAWFHNFKWLLNFLLAVRDQLQLILPRSPSMAMFLCWPAKYCDDLGPLVGPEAAFQYSGPGLHHVFKVWVFKENNSYYYLSNWHPDQLNNQPPIIIYQSTLTSTTKQKPKALLARATLTSSCKSSKSRCCAITNWWLWSSASVQVSAFESIF